MWGKDNKLFPFLFYFFPPWGRLLTQLHTTTSPEAFIWDTTNVHACFCLQAFLTLARDIKAKMDKKLVRVKTRCNAVYWWLGRIFVFAIFSKLETLRLSISGGQQPSEQQPGSQDFRAAQEEQLLPLHASVRKTEVPTSTIALTASPTGQNWTEHTLMPVLFFLPRLPSSDLSGD